MTPRAVRAATARLLKALCEDAAARLRRGDGGDWRLAGAKGVTRLSAELVPALRAAGLLAETAPGELAAGPEAKAWLRRQGDAEMPFRAQHQHTETLAAADGAPVRVNADESPVATLARRSGPAGAWLAPHQVAAAERLRRDFERGRLQPRITANWSAAVSTGRRTGDGLADLTDMALEARTRFDRALKAVGPELSGVLADVCCFLKGLETVERERRWPARSAKLVLRLALEALARHYGLGAAASGEAGGRLRRWGADDYRPRIT